MDPDELLISWHNATVNASRNLPSFVAHSNPLQNRPNVLSKESSQYFLLGGAPDLPTVSITWKT